MIGSNMKAKIKYLSDEMECDTCGWSYAEGYTITFDDCTVIERVPLAHCFGGETYDGSDLITDLANKLGCEVEFEETDYAD